MDKDPSKTISPEDEEKDDSSRGSKSGNHEGTVAIAHKEDTTVKNLKLLVVAVIILATTVLAVLVYFYTADAQQDHFEEQFSELADKVLEAIGGSLDKTFEGIDALSVGVVSYASAANQAWPYVMVPDFGLRAAKTQALSHAKAIVMCPIVTQDTKLDYQNFTLREGRTWVDQTLKVMKTDQNFYGPIIEEYGVAEEIFGDAVRKSEDQIYIPSWQAYPIVPYWNPWGYDYFALSYTSAHYKVVESGKITITEPYMLPDPENEVEVEDAESWAAWYADRISPDEEPLEPASDIMFPILNSVESIKVDPAVTDVVAILAVSFYWRDLIRGILPHGNDGVILVFENPCAPSFTYELSGPEVAYVGRGDHHDAKYDSKRMSSEIYNLRSFGLRSAAYTGPDLDEEYCTLTINVYPSQTLEDTIVNREPMYFTLIIIAVSLVTVMAFMLYDYFVERRQTVVMRTAQRSTAVVSSLFPANVRDQLYAENNNKDENNGTKSKSSQLLNHLKPTSPKEHQTTTGAPIAELYADTTVMFGDIVGFTSWSSSRQPAEVFALLEAIYGEFDKAARKSNVFKVETIGDSYVAVCGLPTPRKNHAAIMVRFAAECREKLALVTKDLTNTLGPGTDLLDMRFGLNSGPTTAGVLRGEKARFQLFGDTVNTAARMESTGVPGKIQISQKTADLLIEAGKAAWVTARDTPVEAKGKGIIQTYFAEPKLAAGTLEDRSSSASEHKPIQDAVVPDKLQLLINWNLDILERLLTDLIAFNKCHLSPAATTTNSSTLSSMGRPRDEVAEAIAIPNLAGNHGNVAKPNMTEVPNVVREQLRCFITTVASMHRNNPFHSFEHATHVVMAARKLLSNILIPVASSETLRETVKANPANSGTYLLTSDPLIQFAIVFSALIHDIDHPGVPNGQLILEETDIAKEYDGKSVAEQNSVSVAWELLMNPKYVDLRSSMFHDKSQIDRFRQLLVNSVLATDIFDSELKSFRDTRWAKVFSTTATTTTTAAAPLKNKNGDDDAATTNLRATIVIEHLIQASDVSHCMQHWKVYEKWNRRLFCEMRTAYKSGRATKDPSLGWYKGELWFFDMYIIPLAKKLKECGVFGVSCDEVLDYAMDNRLEWEQKGATIVAQWLLEEEKDSTSEKKN